jgi:hypothetical protein
MVGPVAPLLKPAVVASDDNGPSEDRMASTLGAPYASTRSAGLTAENLLLPSGRRQGRQRGQIVQTVITIEINQLGLELPSGTIARRDWHSPIARGGRPWDIIGSATPLLSS